MNVSDWYHDCFLFHSYANELLSNTSLLGHMISFYSGMWVDAMCLFCAEVLKHVLFPLILHLSVILSSLNTDNVKRDQKSTKQGTVGFRGERNQSYIISDSKIVL